MRIKRVLLVVKSTAYDKLAGDSREGPKILQRLVDRDDPSVAGIKPAHAEHIASVAQVKETLARRKIKVVTRTRMPASPVKGFDLVITVGGDGMVLGVSHEVRDRTPVLGVNSAPSFSVGYLTGCKGATFGETLAALEADRLQPVNVQRLRVQIGKKVIPEPVLNDVLFCADNPALMTRYRLEWPGGEELQRSSGVWISTPAGSTSALASAGGPILPLTTEQFAFIAREPYAPPGATVRFRSAVLVNGDELIIECRILDASVFLDGSHRVYRVPLAERVRFSLHPTPLRLVRGN
jgi:NAD+ kinase